MNYLKIINQIIYKSRLLLFIMLFLIIFINIALSNILADSVDIYDYNFEELSKLKITTVSKSPQSIRELPNSFIIISSSEIKEKGYFTLDEVLSDLPGFQFRNVQSYNSYVFLRGIPNQNNLVLLLIDGIQVNELNSGGFYSGGQYNLANIERIEVVYGPSAVAYGTNAMSGVINLITKKSEENAVEVSALAGSFNTINANAAFSYINKKGNFGFRVAAMAKTTEKAELSGKAGDNNWTDLLDNYENDYSIDLKANWNNFVFGTNYILKHASASTNIKSNSTIYKDYGTEWNIQFINNYLRYNHKFSDKIDFTTTLYNRNATVLDNSVQFIVDTAQIGYYRPNNLTGIENIINYNSNGILSVTGGLSFEYEELANGFSITYSNSSETKPPTPTSPDMKNNYLISGFIEPQLSIMNNLFLSAGARFDYSSIYDEQFTPKVGVNYYYKSHNIRLTYSEAFRAPKPWDYTDGLGNSSLVPEKMKSIEAGIGLSFADKYKIDIIAYNNIFENAISKETFDSGDYRWINQGEIKTNGLELCFKYLSEKLKFCINYTLNYSLDKNDNQVAEISEHSANASITYDLFDFVKINLRTNYIGERENPKYIESTQSNKIDQYLIFHSTLTFRLIKGYQIQLIAKNLFDAEYYHTSNRPPDRYRQSQRTVLLSVSYSLNY